MINRLIHVSLLLLTTGCQSAWWRTPEPVDPVLNSEMGCADVVAHLNAKNQGLDGWRSGSTVMWVRMPNGVRVRLEGLVACQAPTYFRLTAENMVAEADLGSNASRCWMHISPGEPAVLTWKHEDTTLLQQMPTGLPYIDPAWLMLVLGVTPLDSADYQLSSGPPGTQQYWLTAMEESPTGQPLRRVIKVDRIRGVVREHALYDSERNPLVRATLDQHRIHGGHHIPNKVKLEFPQMDSEISLTFRTIETNPHLSDHLWRVPDSNMQVIDLGQMLRHRFPQLNDPGQPRADIGAARSSSANSEPVRSAANPFAGTQDDVFHPPSQQNPFATPDQQAKFEAADENFSGAAERSTAEPQWDTPISSTRVIPPSTTRQQSADRPSAWRRLWPF